MSIDDYSIKNLIEKEVMPEDNGCSMYALIGAIMTLYPETEPNYIFETLKKLIKTPYEETPLYQIGKENNLLPPILYSDNINDYSITIRDWMLKGQGEPLMSFLNETFSKTNIPIAFTLQERNQNSTNTLISKGKEGAITLVPCVLIKNSEITGYHHVALAYRENDWFVIDLNAVTSKIEENLLITMLEDPNYGIPYLKGEFGIFIENDPLIFIEAKKNI